jgi:hypothetical protein
MLFPQYFIFDSQTQTIGGHWRIGNYNNGAWAGGATALHTLDSSYYGDWVHIQLTEATVLTGFTLYARSTHPGRAPGKFKIYGSNNGTAWTVLYDQTSPLTYSDNMATVGIQGVAAYSYIGMVVSALKGTSDGTLNFVKWKIFGKASTCLLIIACLPLGMSAHHCMAATRHVCSSLHGCH